MWILITWKTLENVKKEATYGDLSLVVNVILIRLLAVEIMRMCYGFS
jgi:hypothetical protein